MLFRIIKPGLGDYEIQRGFRRGIFGHTYWSTVRTASNAKEAAAVFSALVGARLKDVLLSIEIKDDGE